MDGTQNDRAGRHDRHRGRTGRAVGRLPPRQARRCRSSILDADARIGDHWRDRWDSLRLYSPARYDSLPGMRFPAPSSHWPTGREMADYLEAYARQFDLPVRSGTRVERVEPIDGGFVVSTADGGRLAARQVIVATGPFRQPNVPAFAARARPVDPAAALARLPQPGAAQPGPGPRRRPVAFRRRHRVRGRQRRPPDDPLRQVPRPDADQGHRHEAGHARLAGRRVRVRARPHDAHADGAADAPGGPQGRRPAHPGPAGGPRPGRRRAPRREDRRRARRPAGARRRHGARRGQRDLGDRLPARLRVRRGADRRRGRLADRGAWRQPDGAGPVLPRRPVPVRLLVDARGGRRPRRGVRRRAGREAGAALATAPPAVAPAPAAR